MIENKKVRVNKKDSEAGYGMVIVVVIIFFVCVAVFAALASSMRASRSQENLNIRDDEKWAAKSAMATMRRVLEVKIPQKHEAHLTEAQNCLRSMGNPNSTLPVFDEQDAAPESSVPVLLVERNGSASCNQSSGYSATLSYTSLLGNTNAWAQNLLPLWEQDAYGYGYQAEQLKVARIAEQFRRFNGAGDPVYVFGFIIDARGGQHFRIRENGEVTLGDTSQNCGATGKLEITPRTVQRGNPVTFQITYTNVNRLRILNRANNLLHEENVTEQSDPQVFSWNYTPTTTDSYRVEALSSNSGCYSRSEWIEVQVTSVDPPACPVINSLTATPDLVTSGDVSVIQWSTQNAAEVTLEGDIVAASDSRGYIIPAERTFTLIARDAANTCPATRQVTVRINAAACLVPVVSQFTVNPANATPGQSVAINWQVQNVMPGGIVNITLPDGTVLSDVGATGTRTINAPGTAGTYNYSISVVNPCGTIANASTTLQVSSSSCQNPVINSFTANPSTVPVGGNLTIRLSWTIAGTAETVNISSIGAVTGNYIDIPQPQTATTYVLTVTGCSQSVQAQATVAVAGTPVVQTMSKEIVWQSGLFGCGTGNDIRVAAGSPPAPCVVWTVEDTFSLQHENGNNYILTFTSVSNADTHPWFRSKRRPSVQIGVFGAVGYGCFESVINPMCYEDRYQYSFFADYGAFDNTPDIVPIQFPVAPRPDNTYKFRITLAPQAQKVVIREVGSGANYYTIYYPGYNFGPGDTFAEGDLNYGYPQQSASQQSVFDVP